MSFFGSGKSFVRRLYENRSGAMQQVYKFGTVAVLSGVATAALVYVTPAINLVKGAFRDNIDGMHEEMHDYIYRKQMETQQKSSSE